MKQQTITTDDYAALVRNQWTEAEFTTAVIELAQANGWLAYHQRPARLKNGSWRTAVQGDKGFPDVILVRHGGYVGNVILVAELKTGRNKATPEQSAWIDAFAGAEALAYVWRPSDWPEIERVLTKPTE